MPPRIQALPRLGTLNLCLRPAPKTATSNFLPITQTANLSMREKNRKAKQDPYRWAQAQQRKAANVKRRDELRKERTEADGDPIWGITTPFIESLNSAGQQQISKHTIKTFTDAEGNTVEEPVKLPTARNMRNHLITKDELENAIENGKALTKPMVGVLESQMEPGSEEEKVREHEDRHRKAAEALRRITALENGSARDRFHANVTRIVQKFGRQSTDKFLQPKPTSINPSTEPKPARAGPDTGSSEVQIAILTAKIRNLAQALQINRGYKDKHNKRNLRLLLHRRQKLLKYMERKERGSERWTFMVKSLGLTPAMWKGQIEL